MGRRFPTLELPSRVFCKFVALPKYETQIAGVEELYTIEKKKGCMRDKEEGCSGKNDIKMLTRIS